MFIDLILIQIIVVLIVDMSGFIDSFKSFISKILTKGRIETSNYSLRPIDCSFCMNWWVGLVYLIISNHLSLGYITLVLILSFLTTSTKDILLYIKDLMSYLINRLYEWQEKK